MDSLGSAFGTRLGMDSSDVDTYEQDTKRISRKVLRGFQAVCSLAYTLLSINSEQLPTPQKLTHRMASARDR